MTETEAQTEEGDALHVRPDGPPEMLANMMQLEVDGVVKPPVLLACTSMERNQTEHPMT